MPLDPRIDAAASATPDPTALLAQRVADLTVRTAAAERTRNRLSAEALAEVSTTATSYTSLSGGPSITINVPTTVFVVVFAEAELRVSGGGSGDTAEVGLRDPVDQPVAATILSGSTTSYLRFFTTPGGDGTTSLVRAGLLAFPLTPGEHTLEMQYRYRGTTGGLTAFARNRRIWVSTI